MNIAKLGHEFRQKPLVVGGVAKEYHKIRKAETDIDLVVSEKDYDELAEKYPDNLKDLWGDHGVMIDEFEIWKSINLFDYNYLSQGAVELPDCLIISIEKLLLLTALAAENKGKYQQDLKLIVAHIKKEQYKNFDDTKYRKS